MKETERIEELYQLIWPGVEYHSMGQIFLNQEWIGTAFGYGFICALYLVLTGLVRSRKMTA